VCLLLATLNTSDGLIKWRPTLTPHLQPRRLICIFVNTLCSAASNKMRLCARVVEGVVQTFQLALITNLNGLLQAVSSVFAILDSGNI
jgi:hypothetical protein